MKFILFLLLSVNYAILAQDLDVSRNLNVKGKIMLNNDSGTAGQVLMSNGTNSPSWQTLSAGSKFAIQCSNLQINTGDFDDDVGGATNQTPNFNFNAILYETLNDVAINLNSNRIHINKSGLYRFEIFSKFRFTSNQAQNSLEYELRGKIDNSSNVTLHSFFLENGKMEPLGTNTSLSASIHSTSEIYLTQGQSIQFSAGFNGIANSTHSPSQMTVQNIYLRGSRISD